jgi:predicted signal transduction protein with EAL and GGDEF domain
MASAHPIQRGAAEAPAAAFDESARLAELQALNLSVSTGDERLNQLTRLAADLFEVPVALVTLVDRERQTFIANCGLEDLDGTPRDAAFCNHTIARNELLVVPDAMADARFADNPQVTGDPHIRFYAGAVVRGPGGHALGSLCLNDYVPRRFSNRDQRHLVHLARVAESLLPGEGVSDAERPVGRDPDTRLELRPGLRHRLGAILAEGAGTPVSVLAVHIEGLADLDATATGDNEPGSAYVAGLSERFRGVLPRQATLGRWDDDELLVIAPGVAGAEPDTLARQLADAADTPVAIADQSVQRSLSIGITRTNDADTRTQVVIDQARSAARAGDGFRRGRSVITLSAGAERAARQLDIEHRLQAALAQGAIAARFQPRVDIASRRIVGAEALARWHDPELGWISPGEFVPIAERAGLTPDLTAAMMASAVDHALRWRREGASGLRVAVNLSAADLLDPTLVERTRALLAAKAAPGDALEFEVTESGLVTDIDQATAQMHELAELGICFAIDDFGTGYSSFQYLRELPVNQLKIDRSFVQGIVERRDDAAIFEAICAMAGTLRLETVAEGVETADQFQKLGADNGCTQAQGFLFWPAVEADRFSELLRDPIPDGNPD